jgi:hypothetical protein
MYEPIFFPDTLPVSIYDPVALELALVLVEKVKKRDEDDDDDDDDCFYLS